MFLLKYLAFSTATVHLDSYQSGMFHNYYLYFKTDTEKFEWITWDLNMIYNNFPQSGLSDEEATQFLIDEPVMGSLSAYPLVQAVLTNSDYVDTYHEYLLELIDNSLSEEAGMMTPMPGGNVSGNDIADYPGLNTSDNTSFDIHYIVALAASLSLMVGLTVYLYFRKY